MKQEALLSMEEMIRRQIKETKEKIEDLQTERYWINNSIKVQTRVMASLERQLEREMGK